MSDERFYCGNCGHLNWKDLDQRMCWCVYCCACESSKDYPTTMLPVGDRTEDHISVRAPVNPPKGDTK